MTGYPLKTIDQLDADDGLEVTDRIPVFSDGATRKATISQLLTFLVSNMAVSDAVQDALDALIAGAPGALDTFNEIAAAIGDDANYATTVANALAGKQPIDAQLTALAGLTGAAGSFVRWTAPDTAAMQSIVGTVGQSGGVPTGAIIERGSNANGSYIRWADGTQICTKTMTGLGPVNLAFGSCFTTGAIAGGLFAASFSGAPVVATFASSPSGGASWVAGTTPATASSFGDLTLVRPSSSALTDFRMDLTAVGKWF
ncbi:hypothetical protein [Aurantimonas coralicida]|uniref:hypothetical protein n=1 Tax=Aurantimonas coralicida TaxID=182270 RepID=UPI00239C4145|nr:hypothetical protein [Aurantimonas coralicida]MDE0922368.1 hypothetical protein [Aurantimonas coralicida]